ncbi:MAG: DMT family transporter [Fusobacteria bacterium]|nr:DMT family transporter [Fusobacteriota bacterium]
MKKIHISVLMFGITGLFAKFLGTSAIGIVCMRCFWALPFLWLCMAYWKVPFKIESKKDFRNIIFSGILLAITWYCFFESIKISSVSIGLIAYATVTIFTTFLEPLFFKEKIVKIDILIAIITFFGAFLVAPHFSLKNANTLGLLLGVLSAFVTALVTIQCRSFVSKYPTTVVCFYQFLAAGLITLPFAVKDIVTATPYEWMMLIILGVVFTGGANTLFISGLKSVSAQKANIVLTLEPVYGIILAIILLHEIPNFRIVIGGAIILLCALWATMVSIKIHKAKELSSL